MGVLARLAAGGSGIRRRFGTEPDLVEQVGQRQRMAEGEFHDVSSGLDATPLWIPQLGMAVGTTLFALAFLGDLILLLRGEALRDPSAGDEPSRIE